MANKRQYGEHMAKEGEVSAIPTIVLIMYGSIAAYSYMVHMLCDEPIYTIPMYYIAIMGAFYAWHWMAHQSWTAEMHRLHMDHHLFGFPPSDFYGDHDDSIIK